MADDKDLSTGALTLGSRPALIVVDMSLGFTSPDSPLGGDFQSVKAANLSLLTEFRKQHLPIYFSTVVYHDDASASVFRTRLPDLNILMADSKWVQIDPFLKRKDDEVIIEKSGPSAFFGTDLAEQLNTVNADSLVITGLTTSGCVRATVIDGLQNNYPLFVPRQACGDRNHTAAQANLHDIHAKYGQVCELEWIIDKVRQLNQPTRSCSE